LIHQPDNSSGPIVLEDIMTTLASPDATIDQQADIFVEKFAPRLAPIAAYVGAMYGHTPRTIAQQADVIAVVTHAVEFVPFANSFERKRAATSALDIALALVRDAARFELSEIGFIPMLARHIATLANAIADITVETVAAR
jgi:hypothetical protein